MSSPLHPRSDDDAMDAPVQTRKRRALRWLAIAASAAALLTLVVAAVIGARAFAWSDLPAFIDGLGAWRSSPLAMLAMLASFVAGGLVVFPVNLLIAASVIVFGPVAGALVALAGSVASAALLHQIGSAFPEHVWTRIAGRHAERLRERVASHGLLAVALVRVVPVAPYSIVSVAAGVAGIPRVPYLVGTALGMAPGIVLYALFVDRAREVIADPRPLSWAMLLFALLLIVAVGMLVRKLARRRRASAT
ncbi:MAG TPA: VTT domain-containing protein [Rhodanobacteraceae bacterium]|nr:VTT domain-containing protein [Rhodanobacteraceae bacterium]